MTQEHLFLNIHCSLTNETINSVYYHLLRQALSHVPRDKGLFRQQLCFLDEGVIIISFTSR